MKSDLTISEARKGLKSREFSSTELTEYYLARIEQLSALNAFVTIDREKALVAAKKADVAISNGEDKALLGVPIAVKDLFCTNGTRTTACSKILYDFVPPYESTVTQNLLNDGAVFLGKTNMDEFAMGSANITSCFGACFLPFRKKSNVNAKLVPGGSSGGSAAAVASDLCVAATGSDTGGSIRQPASFSGLVGIKPTYGLCSRWGMIAFASSLDQAGPLSKTVEDAAIMLKSMAGYDDKDATSENVEIPDYTKSIGKSIKGMKVGLVAEFMEGLSLENLDVLEKTCGWLKDSGCEIVELSLRTVPYALPAYYIIAPAEAASNLARYDGVRYGYRASECRDIEDLFVRSRSDGFGEEVKRRILTGTYVLSAGYFDAYYSKALKIKKMISDDFRDNAFSKVDIILSMTTPTTAFSIEETDGMSPVEMYLNDMFTVTANIATLPGISVPAGLSSDGLPVGVQLIGNRMMEEMLFRVAHVIEQCANFRELKKSILMEV
ncbi:MAG: Asp-tRNA(Asn)/Glu-tRNA(Gln) amidotransferase subunit GatA [Holosporales bacterium]|jgi:aspartyl-tRNA(Asn)/glutamyl-tRNA(Gln) amidotransferase subunit A|nr:Asp-tRNA(Asn)/Glu-tRNA(Gln) amidotransferase subunit GatA [Holosporales bacterium]